MVSIIVSCSSLSNPFCWTAFFFFWLFSIELYILEGKDFFMFMFTSQCLKIWPDSEKLLSACWPSLPPSHRILLPFCFGRSVWTWGLPAELS